MAKKRNKKRKMRNQKTATQIPVVQPSTRSGLRVAMVARHSYRQVMTNRNQKRAKDRLSGKYQEWLEEELRELKDPSP